MGLGVASGRSVIARIGLGVRFYPRDDFARTCNFFLKGGNAGLLAFVGEARTCPAKGTASHHRGVLSIVRVAGSCTVAAKTFPRVRRPSSSRNHGLQACFERHDPIAEFVNAT